MLRADGTACRSPDPQRFEETVDHLARPPGVDLVTQEYLSACRQLRCRSDLTLVQHERLQKDLDDEHRRRCATEWKILGDQLRADHFVLGTSNGRASVNTPPPPMIS